MSLLDLLTVSFAWLFCPEQSLLRKQMYDFSSPHDLDRVSQDGGVAETCRVCLGRTRLDSRLTSISVLRTMHPTPKRLRSGFH
jgi:hypothetical protein